MKLLVDVELVELIEVEPTRGEPTLMELIGVEPTLGELVELVDFVELVGQVWM